KKPFIISCIAAAVGGGILGFANSQIFMVGGLGIFGIPTYIDPKAGITFGFWGAIIAIIVGFILAFILTYLFGNSKTGGQQAGRFAAASGTALPGRPPRWRGAWARSARRRGAPPVRCPAYS
ncbi:hypothetical protein ABZ787_11735, partial [Micrococcus luteus]|uniref:hypothetical protein n=1 Tax=Micrococcus luteus TaxID=1270 RepID=UPI003481398A